MAYSKEVFNSRRDHRGWRVAGDGGARRELVLGADGRFASAFLERAVRLEFVVDRPAQGLIAGYGALEEGFPREGLVIAPDRKKTGNVAAGRGDQSNRRVLLKDDEIVGGIVIEGLEVAGFVPGPILAGDKTAVGNRETFVVGEMDWDIELAELVAGFELWEKGVWKPADGY